MSCLERFQEVEVCSNNITAVTLHMKLWTMVHMKSNLFFATKFSNHYINKKAIPSKKNITEAINYFCDQHEAKLFTETYLPRRSASHFGHRN